MVESPYVHLGDKELMLKYKDGDHMAFNALYFRHKDKVYSYLSKRLHSKNEIEDLFQKVFTKFHKSRQQYLEKYEVLPWIYTITRSEFLDFIKKKKIKEVEFLEKDYISESTMDNNFIDISSEKILTKKEKKALTERYHRDKDFSEIASILNTSEVNIRKIISRGIKKLRMKLKGENNG